MRSYTLGVATPPPARRRPAPGLAEPPWKVGELARRTGVSVRALHHYDALGLVRPSLRSAAGHRLYAQADVVRLQQVQSLRQVGVSLDDARRLLDGAALAPGRVIALHLARVRAEIARQQRLAARLTAVAACLTAAGDDPGALSAADLCRLIEETVRMDQYFTPEQLQTLGHRREAAGPARQEQVTAEWGEIIPAVRRAIDAGVAPTDPAVQALARRWRDLVREFTGGDPAVADAVRTMYQHEGPALRDRMRPGTVPDPDMFPYMGRAMAALGD